jgi:hypothetical protein
LHYEIRIEWDEIWDKATWFQLEDSQDIIVWNFGKNKFFSVESVYNGLTKSQQRLRFSYGLCHVEPC